MGCGVHASHATAVLRCGKQLRPSRALGGLSLPLRWDGPHSAQTLDVFAREASLPKVHFVKIDTEGAELFVLKAAATVALAHGPVCQHRRGRFPGGRMRTVRCTAGRDRASRPN